MAVTETRLLVLGAVVLFEPVHGYQIRRELMSWEVAVYTCTDSGRAELDVLFGRALETVELLDALPLHTALSMCTLFDRATVEGHLARRADALAVHLEVLAGKVEAARAVAPPHVARVVELQLATAEVELAWVRDLVAEIRAGGLAFAGEPMGWQPAPDDPGWQMAADRDRYRRLLHL